MEPADEQGRVRALGLLLGATVVSMLVSAALFVLVLHGEWMTGLFDASAKWMFAQPAWAVAAAVSPLAGVLLVGYGYASRAIRRRR